MSPQSAYTGSPPLSSVATEPAIANMNNAYKLSIIVFGLLMSASLIARAANDDEPLPVELVSVLKYEITEKFPNNISVPKKDANPSLVSPSRELVIGELLLDAPSNRFRYRYWIGSVFTWSHAVLTDKEMPKDKRVAGCDGTTAWLLAAKFGWYSDPKEPKQYDCYLKKWDAITTASPNIWLQFAPLHNLAHLIGVQRLDLESIAAATKTCPELHALDFDDPLVKETLPEAKADRKYFGYLPTKYGNMTDWRYVVEFDEDPKSIRAVTSSQNGLCRPATRPALKSGEASPGRQDTLSRAFLFTRSGSVEIDLKTFAAPTDRADVEVVAPDGKPMKKD